MKKPSGIARIVPGSHSFIRPNTCLSTNGMNHSCLSFIRRWSSFADYWWMKGELAQARTQLHFCAGLHWGTVCWRWRGAVATQTPRTFSAHLARTDGVWWPTTADWRDFRVPGIRARLLRADKPDVQLPYDQYGQGKLQVETAGFNTNVYLDLSS